MMSVATATMLTSVGSALAQAPLPTRAIEKPTCGSCRIEIARVGQLPASETLDVRDGFNDLVLLADSSIVALPDGAGRWWLVTQAGELLHEYSRDGEGPGEMRQATAVAGIRGDTVAVYDRSLARVSLFTLDGKPIRSMRSPANASSYLWLGDQRGIVVGRFEGTDKGGIRGALPYHLVQGDSVRRSFGPLIRRIDPRDHFQFNQILLSAGWGVIAIPHANEYRIELYSNAGDPVGMIVREAEWFPHADKFIVGSLDDPPSPMILDGWVDEQNRLWLLLTRAGKDWRDAFASQPVQGREGRRVPLERPELYLDGLVEVFDLKSQSLLVSERLPFVAKYALGRGVVATLDREAADGASLLLYRLTLSGN